jgi:hypothetical protein
MLHFDLAAAPGSTVICRIAHDGSAAAPPMPDGEMQLRFDAGACHVFDGAGRRIEAHAAAARPEGIAPLGLSAGAPR